MSFRVNSKADIFQTDPVVQIAPKSQDDSDSTKNVYILCMNIKDLSNNAYSDLKQEEKYYQLYINGEKYFINNEGLYELCDYNKNKFLIPTSSWNEQTQGVLQPINNNLFTTGEHCIYFNTEKETNEEQTFLIEVKDPAGENLSYSKRVSSNPPYMQNLAAPNININDGKVTITPVKKVVNSNDEINIKPTIYYYLDDNEKNLYKSNPNTNDGICEFYLPGGKTKISAYQTCSGFAPSETAIQNSEELCVMWVDEEEYFVTSEDFHTVGEIGGYNCKHAIDSLQKAIDIITAKKDQRPWTIYILSLKNDKEIESDYLLKINNTDTQKLTLIIKNYSNSIEDLRFLKTDIPSKFSEFADFLDIMIDFVQLGKSIQRNSIIDLKDKNKSGIYVNGNVDLTLERMVIKNAVNNSVLDGAGIRFNSTSGNLTLKDCTISNCVARNNGGGLYFSSNGALTINGGTIEQNEASNGGGIYASSSNSNASVTITDANISYNGSVSKKVTSGGGIYSTITTTIEDSTIKYNEATKGSAVYINDVKLTLTSDTISNNNSTDTKYKSSIYTNNDVIITNVNISNPSGTSYPGIYMESTGTTRRNLKLEGKITNCSEIYLGDSKTPALLEDAITTRNSQKLTINYNLKNSPVNYQIIKSNKDINTADYVNKNTAYILFKDGYVYYKDKCTPSISKTIQECIDEQENSIPQNKTVLINFEDNYVDTNGQIRTTNDAKSSPCITNKSDYTYYFYGNGYTYNANRGESKQGPAMFLDTGTVYIDNLIVTGGYMPLRVGGIYIYNSAILILQNGTIIGDTVTSRPNASNYANYGNFGGLYIQGKVIINDSNVKISHNYAITDGGGIFIDSTGTLEVNSNSFTVYNNASEGSGAGICCSNGNLLFNGSCINNYSKHGAPGIYIEGNSKFTAYGATIKNNTTDNITGKIGVGIQFGNDTSGFAVTSYPGTKTNENQCQKITFSYSGTLPNNCADVVLYQKETGTLNTLYSAFVLAQNQFKDSIIQKIGEQMNNNQGSVYWNYRATSGYTKWTTFPDNSYKWN